MKDMTALDVLQKTIEANSSYEDQVQKAMDDLMKKINFLKLLLNQPVQHLVGLKSDVFSFGMCLWELFSDPPKYPWQDEIMEGDKQSMLSTQHNLCEIKTHFY
jgi:hypothetical protein